MPNSFPCRRGFSKIEALALSGVAALTLAIAFPALQNTTQTSAASLQNRENLRAVYLATRQYMADNDNRFMPGGTHRSGAYWWGQVTSNATVDYTRGPLFPYLKSAAPLRSPAFPVNRRAVIGGIAYGYNKTFLGGSFFGNKKEYADKLPTARLEQIADPHLTILFADSARWNNFRKGAPQLEENVFIGDSVRDKFPTFHGRHNGFGHVLFVDGHLAAFKPQAGSVPENWNGPANLGHLPDAWLDRE